MEEEKAEGKWEEES